MKKFIFTIGAVLVSCVALTSCSGGGDKDSDGASVNALSGRTFCFTAPNSTTGTMFVRVGEAIGSSKTCNAVFSFGSLHGDQSDGTVTIHSTTKGTDKNVAWSECDFTFHINEVEITGDAEYKGFNALFLEAAQTATGDEDDDGGDDAGATGGGAADDYVIGVESVLIKMKFHDNSTGSFSMEPTTVYNDDEEAVEWDVEVNGSFYQVY